MGRSPFWTSSERAVCERGPFLLGAGGQGHPEVVTRTSQRDGRQTNRVKVRQ